MCGKQLTDVFVKHVEYEPIPNVDVIDVGRQLFTFKNGQDEYVEYFRCDHDSFLATYTDRRGETHHYRVTPKISIRVSTLVVHRHGYTLVKDTTDIGSMQETAES